MNIFDEIHTFASTVPVHLHHDSPEERCTFSHAVVIVIYKREVQSSINTANAPNFFLFYIVVEHI